MNTIIQLFEESVKKFGSNPYLWEKNSDKYEPLSYQDLHKDVKHLAAGLYALEIDKGDRIGLLSEGRNAWVLSELGILFTGAVNVPLSVKLDAQNELKFRLIHSESRFVIVSKNHLEKIRLIKDQIETLEKVIVIDDDADLIGDEVYLSDIINLGSILADEDQKKLNKIQQEI